MPLTAAGRWSPALWLCLLAACGGGGGGSEPPAAPSTPLAINEAPRAQQVGQGETAVFVVAAQGSGALGYQWLRDGVPIDGEVRPRLEVRARAEAQAHRYTVRVTDASGSITSEPVQYVLREPGEWERWAAAPAGPTGLFVETASQFHNDARPYVFDLYLASLEPSARAVQVQAQGNWEPMIQVRDWAGGLPGGAPRAAGPPRAYTYAANGRLWRLDLRVLRGEEAQPRMLSTQLSRQMCPVDTLFQDRVDAMRSLLVYSLPQIGQGCHFPDTAQHRIVRLNHQPFEAPIELPPRTRPLFALYDAEGTITGLVAREAGGGVTRFDARDFRPEAALTLAAGAIETLLQPGPGQPWWVFSDGARILSVQVDAPTPWPLQTLAAAGTAGGTLPAVLGTGRIDGQLAMLLWEPPTGDAAGGRLRACAVSGCPAGARELLAPTLGYTSAVRVPDAEGSERAWFVLGDRHPASTSSSLSVAQLRGDGSVSVRLTVENDPWHNPQRRIVGLFGDWLLSVPTSGATLGLPVAAGLPERMLAPTGTFLPNPRAARADRFWFESRGDLELRDAQGELLQTHLRSGAAWFANDWQGVGDELLVFRPGVESPELVGVDPVFGTVLTYYGPIPGPRDGVPDILDPPLRGHLVLFTRRSINGSSNSFVSPETLSAIRVGTPGFRALLTIGP